MSKPLGVSFSIRDGAPSLRVKRPSSTEDMIWDAVEDAIDSNWTPDQFRDECADAWRQRLETDAKDAQQIIAGKKI